MNEIKEIRRHVGYLAAIHLRCSYMTYRFKVEHKGKLHRGHGTSIKQAAVRLLESLEQ